ncbi:2og-fe oxygenase superfamily protein : Alkylated DNA repair protein AlkB OS=Vibrio sp. JCM 19052 GN=JCM19052_2904 PE=4 SV=1: 2OG-FeII_Oxy_2 [Gemmataceae bacterium]|nr:2og-fe oxygenase superfamily protein : Alkylated DNA repair protein AlkB OS=Vibrio sp. JCM 19052 GN=JCM19052_2904 PE=4 SV=1: 2OG-FeII_Oxy_2 [Gemmataceae bacterium]VTT96440.1 2og-fe oxygenase superfamily protein : Alkylated DNA repair protein AlkB OS=Vibrio sp. JCM 19052 GN=JCM19052_2904 PE=4 SV=1: 2OG-FeII_Oxy_2 [Gemmataceae bacterium]
MPEWRDIRDGGRLLYDPGFCTREEADAFLAWLQSEIPGRQETVRGNPLPRLNAWFADDGLRYSYSGLSHVGSGWLPELAEVKRHVEAASGTTFNSLLLNRYRTGQDSIGYHTDAEPELGENPAVATVSFGSERDFVLRHRKKREVLTYRVGHGSLLVMAGTSQHHWLHSVPKTDEVVGERISLTFRLILGAEGAPSSKVS